MKKCGLKKYKKELSKLYNEGKFIYIDLDGLNIWPMYEKIPGRLWNKNCRLTCIIQYPNIEFKVKTL